MEKEKSELSPDLTPRFRPGAPAFDVVAVAASEGGLEANRQLLAALPPDFPVPLALVQHRSSVYASNLGHYLGRQTRLLVKEAEDGEPLRAGVVYLGPPGRHFLIGPERRVCLGSSTPENFFCPAADVLFESAASTCGGRTIAVVLTGNRNDGARGVQAIKRAGGRVLVQDQATSQRFAMPSAALSTGCVDFALPLGLIASALVTLTMVQGAASLFKVPVPPWAGSTTASQGLSMSRRADVFNRKGRDLPAFSLDGRSVGGALWPLPPTSKKA